MQNLISQILDNLGWILLFLFLGGGAGIYNIIYRWVVLRNQRKLEQERHVRRLALLQEKRRLAEATGEAVKLLIADTALGWDFDSRLRVALTKEDASGSIDRDAEAELEAEEDARVVESRPRAAPKRRRSR